MFVKLGGMKRQVDTCKFVHELRSSWVLLQCCDMMHTLVQDFLL